MQSFTIRTQDEDQEVKEYLDKIEYIKFHCHYHCGVSPLDHSCSHKNNDAGRGWCQRDRCPLRILPSFDLWKWKKDH